MENYIRRKRYVRTSPEHLASSLCTVLCQVCFVAGGSVYPLYNNLDNKRYAPYIPEIRPSSSPSSKNTCPLWTLPSRKFPRIANRAMGMAMVKPNCPTKASDPQTEGGCFLFIFFGGAINLAPTPPCPLDQPPCLRLRLVTFFLFYYTNGIISHGT